MISPEADPSPDDPSPRLIHGIDTAIEHAHEQSSPLAESFQRIHPLESSAGTATMAKLAPHVTRDALLSLRDTISAEHQRLITQENEVVTPETVFARWVKRLHQRRATNIASPSAENNVQITQPIDGETLQLFGYDPQKQRILVLRRSFLTGSFEQAGEVYAFDPSAALYDVGVIKVRGNDPYNFRNLYGKSFTSFSSGSGDTYKDVKTFGHSADATPIVGDKRQRALSRAVQLIENFNTSEDVTSW